MDKCGRRRRNWEREDPQFNEKCRDRKLNGSDLEHDNAGHTNKSGPWNQGETLTQGNLGAASNRRKKRKVNLKGHQNKPGLQTTFVPTFNGNPDDLFRKFGLGLAAAGYSEITGSKCTFCPLRRYHSFTNSINYSISLSISKGYEVRADFVDSMNSTKVPRAISISERPLNWVHYTLLGNGELADMRMKLRTIVPISERLKFLALGDSRNSPSPILWRTNAGEEIGDDTAPNHRNNDTSVQALVPVFSPHTDPSTKKKVIYIRHYIAEMNFKKKCDTFGFSFEMHARITLVREFWREEGNSLDFTKPVKKAEIALDFSVEQASKLNTTEMEQFSCSILREGVHLAQELKRQNVRL
eukprot:CAMPEP_0198279484 /NCGR_PEP_ID=MMETSP1447-20131203/66952_1 /TAXON_ID=420782 /ORGANISM="Chaetoceros dichaeta, Strain CCMP1751" /LENGTH=354 /DNA_ID=CAMNT_0043974669 /DNA_START=1079 /DNA_END=2143 /DNA_ORIENTATION=+